MNNIQINNFVNYKQREQKKYFIKLFFLFVLLLLYLIINEIISMQLPMLCLLKQVFVDAEQSPDEKILKTINSKGSFDKVFYELENTLKDLDQYVQINNPFSEFNYLQYVSDLKIKFKTKLAKSLQGDLLSQYLQIGLYIIDKAAIGLKCEKKLLETIRLFSKNVLTSKSVTIECLEYSYDITKFISNERLDITLDERITEIILSISEQAILNTNENLNLMESYKQAPCHACGKY